MGNELFARVKFQNSPGSGFAPLLCQDDRVGVVRVILLHEDNHMIVSGTEVRQITSGDDLRHQRLIGSNLIAKRLHALRSFNVVRLIHRRKRNEEIKERAARLGEHLVRKQAERDEEGDEGEDCDPADDVLLFSQSLAVCVEAITKESILMIIAGLHRLDEPK